MVSIGQKHVFGFLLLLFFALHTTISNSGETDCFQTKQRPSGYSDLGHTFLEKLNMAYDEKDDKGYYPLHYAAALNEVAALIVLLENKVDVDVLDGTGNTPLQLALLNKGNDTVAWLLCAGADPTVLHNGLNLLHLAALNSAIEPRVLAYLIQKHGFSPSDLSESNSYPLHYALHNIQNIEKINYLLSSDDKLDEHINHVAAQGYSPLLLACELGEPQIIESLLDRGAYLDRKLPKWEEALGKYKGDQALYQRIHGSSLAKARSEYPQILDTLLAEIKSQHDNSIGPVQLAAAKGMPEFITWLVEHEKMDVNEGAGGRGTGLHLAVENGDLDMVKQLEKIGFDLNATNAAGQTPLLLAIQNGELAIYTWLAAKGSDLTAADNEGNGILHYIVTLAENPRFKNKGLNSGKAYWTAYMDVLKDEEKSTYGEGVFQYPEIKVNAVNKQGMTAMDLFGERHYTATILSSFGGIPLGSYDLDDFVDYAKENKPEEFVDGRTYAHYAMSLDYAGAKRVWEFMKYKGVDIEQPDGQGVRPMHLAARNRNILALDWLKAQGIDLLATDKKGRPALYYALSIDANSTEETLNWLVENGADVNGVMGEAGTPFHVVASLKSWHPPRWLIEHGADPVAANRAIGDLPSPLDIAIPLGNHEVIDVFLQNGVVLTPAQWVALKGKKEPTRLAEDAMRDDRSDVLAWLAAEMGLEVRPALLTQAQSAKAEKCAEWLAARLGGGEVERPSSREAVAVAELLLGERRGEKAILDIPGLQFGMSREKAIHVAAKELRPDPDNSTGMVEVLTDGEGRYFAFKAGKLLFVSQNEERRKLETKEALAALGDMGKLRPDRIARHINEWEMDTMDGWSKIETAVYHYQNCDSAMQLASSSTSHSGDKATIFRYYLDPAESKATVELYADTLIPVIAWLHEIIALIDDKGELTGEPPEIPSLTKSYGPYTPGFVIRDAAKEYTEEIDCWQYQDKDSGNTVVRLSKALVEQYHDLPSGEAVIEINPGRLFMFASGNSHRKNAVSIFMCSLANLELASSLLKAKPLYRDPENIRTASVGGGLVRLVPYAIMDLGKGYRLYCMPDMSMRIIREGKATAFYSRQ